MQHFGGLGLQKRCSPKKTHLSKPKQAKTLYCPKKTKKEFETLDANWPGGLQTLVFLVFLGQYSISALFALKTLVFFWTVQHFGGLGLQKRCTVPKKTIFLSQNKQKRCTVPKKAKKQSLETLDAKWPGGLQTLVFCFFCDSTAFLHCLL